MDVFPLRGLTAKLAAQVCHQLGVRGLGAVLALTGIGLGTAVIAVAPGKGLVAPDVAIRAIRLAGIPTLDRAGITQRTEHFTHCFGEPRVVVRAHPVIGLYVDGRQRGLDAVGIAPGQLDRVDAQLQPFAQHVGLVVVGIGHQHTLVTTLTLHAGEDISGQKRPGDMAYVQIAVGGRGRDGDDELTHPGTPWSRCAAPRTHSRSSCPTRPHRSGSPRRTH